MKPHTSLRQHRQLAAMARQGGLVLFMALIALVAMSLAAAALVRSVDTGTLVAGNLSFKQSGTLTADIGVEMALSWLDATYNANTGKNPATDASHPFNNSGSAAGTLGYYSHMTADPTAEATWAVGKRTEVGTFGGNRISYIIQRMCRLADKPSDSAECLYSDADTDSNSHKVCHYNENCGQVETSGRSPVYRITARAEGPKNTVSYVQALVY